MAITAAVIELVSGSNVCIRLSRRRSAAGAGAQYERGRVRRGQRGRGSAGGGHLTAELRADHNGSRSDFTLPPGVSRAGRGDTVGRSRRWSPAISGDLQLITPLGSQISDNNASRPM